MRRYCFATSVALLVSSSLMGCEKSPCPARTTLSGDECVSIDNERKGVSADSDAPVSAEPPSNRAGEASTLIDAGAAKEPSVCALNERLCMERELFVCNASLSGFTLDTECEFGCNVQRKACNACDPSAAPVCSGRSTVVSCRSDGSSEVRSPCANVCTRGVCVECIDASQCASDDPCRPGRCDADTGRCADGLAPIQTPCGDHRFCDGMGACVACTDDSQCAGNETCNQGACVARPALTFVSGSNGTFHVTLARGYSLLFTVQYSSTNVDRRPIGITSSTEWANCMRLDATTPSCTVAASNLDRTITLTGPMEICKKAPLIKPDQIVLGFEDYPEADPNVADCLDPKVTLSASPEG